MSKTRRWGVAAVWVGLLAAAAGLALGQRRQEIPVLGVYSQPITLPINRQAQQVMAKSQELIDEKKYARACEALQYLLRMKDDHFVQVPRVRQGQKGGVLYVSIRAEANRLLGTLPEEGLRIYEQLYGRLAATRLAAGRAANDPQILADVAQRYFHTKAGGQATELLATRCLEREEFLMASLYFERLRSRPDAGNLAAQTLLKAALACYRAGDRANGDELWKLLTEKAKRDGGLSLGGRLVSLERAREAIDKVTLAEARGAHHWTCYRGSPNRSGQAVAGKPDLEHVAWSMVTTQWPDRAGNGVKAWTEEALTIGTRTLEQRNQPILPAHYPLAIHGKIIFPTYNGVCAADPRESDPRNPAWYVPTDRGVLRLFDSHKATLEGRWNTYKNCGPQSILFQNSTIGTLSSDMTRLFVVDDVALPPHPTQTLLMQNIPNPAADKPEEHDETGTRNTLKCFNLDSAILTWELGYKGIYDNTPLQDFDPSFFLGAPLPLSGKLYVLNEKSGDIRLVCLEPKDGNHNGRPPEIVWTQLLAHTEQPIDQDMTRRIHAAHIAYGEGLLVCPTHAGALLAVDLLTHSLAWAHFYREPPPPAKDANELEENKATLVNQLANQWHHSAPAIAEGKVVFTAPDATDISCVNLRDGRRVWKQPRGPADLYFAGIYQSKAIVVGKNYLHAYHLTDGTTAWETKELTGTPTGQGIAADNIYYLPVKNVSLEPEIVTINLADGKVTGHVKSEKKDILGNLIFHDGFLISQTANSITAFPLK